MGNQELQELMGKVVSIVTAAGVNDSIAIDAQFRKYRSEDAISSRGYLVSIFHSNGSIHQYTKLTADEVIKEAEVFAEKYKSGHFVPLVNTYKEEL